MNGTRSDSLALREARLDDGPAASELVRHLGLAMPTTAAAVDAHWRRLWVDNPALKDTPNPPALGWVLEKDGQMVGFFCNVPRLYYYGQRRLTVAVASQWGLDKRHRRKIHQLAAPYFEQRQADILIATTANSSAGRIFQHYGADAVPQPTYDQALYWVINESRFIRAALQKKGMTQGFSRLLSIPAGPILGATLAASGRQPKGQKANVRQIAVTDIDDSFNDLWQRKRDESVRLLACRSADSLRWHFTGQPLKETCLLVHRQDRLRGYCALMREDIKGIELKRLRIVDLFVENNDARVINDLLCAAYQYGREQNYDVLEWVGMPADLRLIAHKHKPFIRALPTWPLYYKALNRELTAPLQQSAPWYISPYDGDTTLA